MIVKKRGLHGGFTKRANRHIINYYYRGYFLFSKPSKDTLKNAKVKFLRQMSKLPGDTIIIKRKNFTICAKDFLMDPNQVRCSFVG